jgi:hypothetical protein
MLQNIAFKTRFKMISRRIVFVSLLLALGAAAEAKAQSLHGRYFVVVWGYEGQPNVPENSHTFATFYRGDDLALGQAGLATISWIPPTGIVRPGVVERGKNFSLGETLALATRHHYRVAAFGPYEISAETYSNSLARIRLLNSGKVLYAMINGPGNTMNCIEAAGSVGEPIHAGFSYGFAASQEVASHLANNYSQVDHDAAARLNLGRYTK